jgi:hypothetical protein
MHIREPRVLNPALELLAGAQRASGILLSTVCDVQLAPHGVGFGEGTILGVVVDLEILEFHPSARACVPAE